MISSSSPTVLHRFVGSRRLLMLAAALVGTFAMCGTSWANSCSSFISLTPSQPQAFCTISPTSADTRMSLRNVSFKSQGEVVIYTNSLHNDVADVVTFTDVHGMATITFESDPSSIPNLPVIGTYTQGQFAFLTLGLTNGKVMHVGICTDDSTGCSGSDGSLRLSVGNAPSVPEPGTLLLVGTGLIAAGALGVGKGERAQRFRQLLQSWHRIS